MKQIKIGTMVRGMALPETLQYIDNLGKFGFESIELTFSKAAWEGDFTEYAKRVRDAAERSGMVVSALGFYGNVLVPEGAELLGYLSSLIDNASLFGADVVAGFAGRLPDQIPTDSLPKFKEVWTPLVKQAADKGVKIAFENCPMGGSWTHGAYNIATNPKMWELMFNEIPADNLGLEWEPTHQMVQLIEPIPQLRKWAKKVFHVHGKDATVMRDVIAEKGIMSGEPWIYHRTPGFGDCNWTDIITILRLNGYEGTIDIEGWHDPVYRGDWEITGQVHALHYLKQCRGEDFIPAF